MVSRDTAGGRGTLAFVLFKYFPFGGMQRDFLRIAATCRQRGYAVRVYALSWQGEKPDWLDLVTVPVTGLTNAARYRRFVSRVRGELDQHPAVGVVGFNKMPGLDLYYAADPCFEERARQRFPYPYRWTSRYRTFAAFERAVFGPAVQTLVLVLTERQRATFQRFYGTADSRFRLVPPGVSRDRLPGPDAAEVRLALRRELAVAENDPLLLFVGSGFRTKGLDRAIRAVGALPAQLRGRVRLAVIGQDNPRRFVALARRLGVAAQLTWLAGRDDVARFLQAADLLIHPAYAETGGIVLLEAAVAGLPVMTTDVCGFASYIAEAEAGVVLASPFSQPALDESLRVSLEDANARRRWSANGLAFGRHADIYDMPERVADLIEARVG
jgi:UDP-glucose:(heptosyl)LPS alpha-1,3-glucosyltransferase